MWLQVNSISGQHPQEFTFVSSRPFLRNLLEASPFSFTNDLLDLLAALHFLMNNKFFNEMSKKMFFLAISNFFNLNTIKLILYDKLKETRKLLGMKILVSSLLQSKINSITVQTYKNLILSSSNFLRRIYQIFYANRLCIQKSFLMS